MWLFSDQSFVCRLYVELLFMEVSQDTICSIKNFCKSQIKVKVTVTDLKSNRSHISSWTNKINEAE